MVFFLADNIISSLGTTTSGNFDSMMRGEIGIKTITNSNYYPEPFLASVIDENNLETTYFKVAVKHLYTYKTTKLEKMIIASVDDAISKSEVDIKSPRTAIILSTTKGNINLLDAGEKEKYDKNRDLLWKLGEVVQDFFGNPNKVIVLSNACVSGVLAINTAAMYINSGMYDNVIVTGGDIVSKFVVSGFMSFLSLSPGTCRPFDINRDGLSLGEAAATVVMGNELKSEGKKLIFKGGATANDANHISGPSRTGDGSFISIKKAMKEAGITSKSIDHISAHGTATPYNDEMEGIALDRIGLLHAPLNSIKGYIGHTLGAAGIVETAILLEEMRRNTMLKTAGFSEHGVSKPVNILKENEKRKLACCLKMASGFGGSNAALIVAKQ
jgi:3-oxoacyl-[acyl-carrier-protein] synthase I